MKYTVVVTFYNSEKTVRDTIDSVLSQTYDDFEVIMVDDGSTDSTERICKSLLATDSRLSYHRQENSGVSVARNYGIEQATGEYVVFVDGDDKLLPDSLGQYERFLQAHPVDVCFSKFLLVQHEAISVQSPLNCKAEAMLFSTMEEKKAITSCLLEGRGFYDFWTYRVRDQVEYPSCIWAKAFKVAYLRREDIEFRKELRRCQDLDFSLRVALQSSNIGFLPVPTYRYVIDEGSLSHKYNPQILYLFDILIDQINSDLRGVHDKSIWNDLYLQLIFNFGLHAVERGAKNPTSREWKGEMKKVFSLPKYRTAVRKARFRSFRNYKENIKIILFKLHCYSILRHIYQ